MKIGVYNIFLILGVSCGLGGGLLFCYWGAASIAPTISFGAILYYAVFAILTAWGLYYLIYHLRFLAITKDRIITFNLWKLKKVSIQFANKPRIAWSLFDRRGQLYKQVNITDAEGNTISFSDLEFENFLSLANAIEIHSRSKIPPTILIEQARNNKPQNTFVLALLLAELSFFLYLGVGTVGSAFSIGLISISLLLTILLIKRRIYYLKWIKLAKIKS